MRALAATLVAVLALALGAATAHAAATISMSGEQVTEALVADLAYFYRHDVRHAPRFELAVGDSGGGIADVERGVTDAGLVSRPLAPSDPSDLQLTQLALSGVCLVSNRVNPVPDLTHDQVQDIVAGRVTSWGQIPGSNRTDPIVPVALVSTAGAASVFQSVFINMATPIVWQPVTLLTGPQVRDYTEQTPAGLGYVDLAIVGPLHVIDYEGVGCTRQTIQDGTYPARRPLGVVTRGPPRGALARFLHWAETSRLARRVIATHYVPG
jgi:phosphate transport system substrate-binding protein